MVAIEPFLWTQDPRLQVLSEKVVTKGFRNVRELTMRVFVALTTGWDIET